VRVLDTVDPEVAREHFAWQARVGARVVVISKSGTTIEILRLLDVLLDRGLDRVVFVADPVRTPMDERFAARGCAVDRFEMPADVGGRYSVLTAVGQVPLRCAGLDGHALLDGASQLRAQWIAEASREGGAAASHDADDLDAIARAIAFRLAHPAAVHVLWCYADRLLPYAAWLQQLDNESLGRHRGDGDHVGEILLPLRGPADQHSVAQLLLDGPRDKRALFLDRDAAVVPALDDGASDPFARLESLRAAEARAAFEAVGEVHPTARWVMPDTGLATLGAAFLRGMMEVVALGAAMGIDPYGQPAVEAIKRRIREG
jgi:glucose-6-phosphate isomerase